jgi:hypothetical protein
MDRVRISGRFPLEFVRATCLPIKLFASSHSRPLVPGIGGTSPRKKSTVYVPCSSFRSEVILSAHFLDMDWGGTVVIEKVVIGEIIRWDGQQRGLTRERGMLSQ